MPLHQHRNLGCISAASGWDGHGHHNVPSATGRDHQGGCDPAWGGNSAEAARDERAGFCRGARLPRSKPDPLLDIRGERTAEWMEHVRLADADPGPGSAALLQLLRGENRPATGLVNSDDAGLSMRR